jgi:Gti1/Pac2 family transcription factor
VISKPLSILVDPSISDVAHLLTRTVEVCTEKTSSSKLIPFSWTLEGDAVNGTSVCLLFIFVQSGPSSLHSPVAYFTQDSLQYLKTIQDIPGLANLHVPPGKYKSARSAKGRPRDSYDPFQVNPWTGVSPHSSYTAYTQIPPNSLTTPLLTGPPPTYHPESPTNGPRSPTSNRSRSSPEKILAPLAYLENIPPPRRHPLDEEALMSFSGA